MNKENICAKLNGRFIRTESTHDRVVVSRAYLVSEKLDANGREVAPVSDYEILMIVLAILVLPITACSFLLALLNYLDNKRDNKRK